MISVWSIESDPDYRNWLATVREENGDKPFYPADGLVHKRATGSYRVGRGLVLARLPIDGGPGMDIGVQVSIPSASSPYQTTEFYKFFPDDFRQLVEHEFSTGSVMDGNRYEPVDMKSFEEAHGLVQKMEFCSSHVGGFTRALAVDGASIIIDEC